MTPLASLERDRTHASRVVRETARVLREGTGTAVVLGLITSAGLGAFGGLAWLLAPTHDAAASGLLSALSILGPGLVYLAALAAFLGVAGGAPGVRAALVRLRSGLVLALPATLVVVVGGALVAWSVETTRSAIAALTAAPAPRPLVAIVVVAVFLFILAWVAGALLPPWFVRRLSGHDVAPNVHVASTARGLLIAGQVVIGVVFSRGAFGGEALAEARLVVAVALAALLDAAVTAAVVSIARAAPRA